MTQRLRWRGPAIVCAAVLLSACAPHRIHRSDYSLCVSGAPETECTAHALQEYRAESGDAPGYVLGFVELDDQGQLFDRRQMRAVVDHLFALGVSQERDALIVVFVHGWKHSAAPGDGNVATFRGALAHLAATEARIARAEGRAPRNVAGVYLGWRGASLTWPLVRELTFWDRKNTAHKVGRGGATEVLDRIELVRRTKASVSGDDGVGNRLVVVGHSFGGAVVFSALSQILEHGFIHTAGPAGTISGARGFGDLVVLINPAFEAGLYTPLSDMSTERGSYFPGQLPVLAILTSEDDDATGTAFPLGRWFSTLFEKTRPMQRRNGVTGQLETIDQGDANVTAVGHFDPYRTHSLRAADTPRPEPIDALSVERSTEAFFRVSRDWEGDAPGSRIAFPGSVLVRNESSAGRNPYLNVRVDGELIADHNDIDDPRVIDFISQLILISAQSRDPAQRGRMRDRALGD